MMQRAGRCALMLGMGYLLGRRKKLGVALVLGGAAAAGRLSTNSGGLLRQGVQALGGSADLGRVLDLRGPLVAAGKAAATRAVSSRIDRVSDRLADQAESLRSPRQRAGQDADDATDQDADREPEDAGYDEDSEPEDRQRRPRDPQRGRGQRDERYDETDADDEGDEDEPDEGDEDEPDEGDVEAYDEEPEPPRRRPTRSARPTPRPRPAASDAPVRRRGR
ncbi:hypothetical protein ACFFWC_25310 [Plantactinospora siamensis]|uniref:DNA primase n=1 Tax=Plantactinospora siamensis TaxID=555372 RepID=A0ABV6NW82_9ACTN